MRTRPCAAYPREAAARSRSPFEIAAQPAQLRSWGVAAAVTHALRYQVGVFVLAFLLMLALSARRGHNAGAALV